MNMIRSARSTDYSLSLFVPWLIHLVGIGSIESVRHTMVKDLELEKPCDAVALNEEGLTSMTFRSLLCLCPGYPTF